MLTTKTIRVLVVDDSPLMREILSDALKAAPGFEVVGTAADGHQALEAFDRLSPDVITLDVQMPKLDGLATLDALLARRPVPVVMVSAQTQRGAHVTLDALDRGAVDYLAKPDGAAGAAALLADDLIRKVRMAAGTDVAHMLKLRKARAEKAQKTITSSVIRPLAPTVATGYEDKLIVIGISTGGPPALTSLFVGLEPPLPPIVIVQHMPAQFTGPFAQRLGTVGRIPVKEAETGDVLQPGRAYLAPGGRHLAVRRSFRGGAKLEVFDADPVSGHRPSVDVAMTSAAEVFADRCLGVIMTGMGHDGVLGCKAIRTAGGFVLGQDQATSDVYGMNKLAFTDGGVDRQFALDDGAAVIIHQARRLGRLARV